MDVTDVDFISVNGQTEDSSLPTSTGHRRIAKSVGTVA
jgi:hypothetical protein